MISQHKTAQNIDEYIAGFPIEVQQVLQQLRKAIRKAAPEAQEKISYAIPAFTMNNRPIAYFAGYKKHIGFYPAPRQVPLFKEELSHYKGGKGTIQFPLDQPLPLDLVTRIIKFRINENQQKIKKPSLDSQDNFLSLLSAPAQRALKNKNITTLRQLSKCTEKEILSLHGMGPHSVTKLSTILRSAGLSFK